MKNSIFLKVLACALVCMMISCNAFADTEKQIEFYGIPWGISITELVDELKERNIPVNEDNVSHDANMAIWSYEFRNSYVNDIKETGYKMLLNYSGNKSAPKIAGFPLKSLEFYAHYDIADGNLNRDENKSIYYMAEIWFDVDDEMAVSVYKDISDKLTSLYGEGKENMTFITDTTYTYRVWNGADDTAVCLYRSESNKNNYQFVHLMYGKTNIAETLHNVRNLVIEKKIQDISNDTTGL